MTTGSHKVWGDVVYVRMSDGRGAVWRPGGESITFVDVTVFDAIRNAGEVAQQEIKQALVDIAVGTGVGLIGRGVAAVLQKTIGVPSRLDTTRRD